jgi:hypothetical protein
MSDMNHGNLFFNTTIPFETLNHEVLSIPSWFGYGQIRNNSSLIVFTTNSRRNSSPCRTWVNQEQWNQIIHTNKLQHARGIDPSDQKEMQKSKKCLGKIWEQGAHGLKPWHCMRTVPNPDWTAADAWRVQHCRALGKPNLRPPTGSLLTGRLAV